MITIHALAAADRDEWLPLWHAYLEFYETDPVEEITDAAFARLVDPTADMYGALARDAEGRAIGFTHWLTHPATWALTPYCYLEDLYVDPDARGSGAGTALIEHVNEWATATGCAKVYWLTHETNSTARSLYGRVATATGFVQYEIPH